jgi:hypothetical protein
MYMFLITDNCPRSTCHHASEPLGLEQDPAVLSLSIAKLGLPGVGLLCCYTKRAGSCSKPSGSDAWWQVDLGQLSVIKNIYIYISAVLSGMYEGNY